MPKLLLEDWPEITWEVGDNVRRGNLDTVTPEDVKDWQPGETVLLSGKMLTGRDAAHKKMVDMIDHAPDMMSMKTPENIHPTMSMKKSYNHHGKMVNL